MGYTREQFRHSAPPRIMGSESEINVNAIDNDVTIGTRIFKNAIAAVPYINRGRSEDKSIILPNGGEIYLDVSNLVESATPECRNAHELLLHELIGERAVCQIASNIPTNPQGNAYKRSGYAKIRSLDGTLVKPATSAGHHENYFYIPPIIVEDQRRELEEMKSYLSTRSSWAGTGIVGHEGYAIAQKQNAYNFKSSAVTGHGNKCALKTQEADLRLEVRTGEGNISEWAIVQKFALSSLVLRLIEHRQFPSDLRLENHKRIVEVSPFALVDTDRGQMTSFGHQRAIARSALNYFELQDDVPEEELLAAEEVIKVCDAIGRIRTLKNDLSSIDDRVEWASKLSYIQRKHPLSSIQSSNLHAVAMDLNWDNLGPRGSGKRWYKMYGTTTDPAIIEKNATIPPNTRAAARVAQIKQMHQDGVEVTSVDWRRISHKKGSVTFADPFEAA